MERSILTIEKYVTLPLSDIPSPKKGQTQLVETAGNWILKSVLTVVRDTIGIIYEMDL